MARIRYRHNIWISTPNMPKRLSVTLADGRWHLKRTIKALEVALAAHRQTLAVARQKLRGQASWTRGFFLISSNLEAHISGSARASKMPPAERAITVIAFLTLAFDMGSPLE